MYLLKKSDKINLFMNLQDNNCRFKLVIMKNYKFIGHAYNYYTRYFRVLLNFNF